MKQQSLSGNCRSVNVNAFTIYGLAYFRAAAFLFIANCLLITAYAQSETSQFETAPPPLKILSKSEKSRLEAVTDIKARTKLSLELMEARLLNAEGYSGKEQYPEMFDELGSFHALVDNTLDFLNAKNNNSGRVLNNFKRIELSLRKYITRLEIIREARTKAVEPLFDDTVLPEKKPQ
jgi:hypothetical protein